MSDDQTRQPDGRQPSSRQTGADADSSGTSAQHWSSNQPSSVPTQGPFGSANSGYGGGQGGQVSPTYGQADQGAGGQPNYGQSAQPGWSREHQAPSGHDQQAYGYQAGGQQAYGYQAGGQQAYGGQQQQRPYGAPYAYPVRHKSMIAAALLAFFLGTLGVHNFYLGYTGKGVTQLVLTIIGWATSWLLIGFIPIAIVAIWAFIEFILILVRAGSYAHDAEGVPLD